MFNSNLRKIFILIIFIFWVLIISAIAIQYKKNSITGRAWTLLPLEPFTAHTQQRNIELWFSIDSKCIWNKNDTSASKRAGDFNNIYESGFWGTGESRSGGGSSITGAFDWIYHLRTIVKKFNITSIADIPCGDTYWQFSVKEINTISQLYFGGDISSYVIERNRMLYKSHKNKIFDLWDLVHCQVPTFSCTNGSHERKGKREMNILRTELKNSHSSFLILIDSKIILWFYIYFSGNRFELVVFRDVLQHMHVENGLKAVQNIVHSGAKYMLLSSYPPGNQPSSHYRSLEKNEPLPSIVPLCEKFNYCALGAIQDGNFYQNNINCPPFNFPLNKSLLVQPSHKQFPHENDEIHLYEIDDELKEIVRDYHLGCKNTTNPAKR